MNDKLVNRETEPRLIGVDVGGSHVAIAIAALEGQILSRQEVRLDFRPVDPDGNVARLLGVLDGLLAALAAGTAAVLAVGVPATVDFDTGLVGEAPFLGWTNLPLKTILEERYHLAALIDNDVNLACLGEARFGAGRGARNLVCIMIGTNIGGGIIIDGNLYRGPNGAAGEIGWMVPDPALLGQDCRVFGGLEDYAGGKRIASRAQELFQQNPAAESTILRAVNGNIEAIRAEHVFDAALDDHDPVARLVLDKVVDYLAVSVANIISLLDPEVIVIGGGVARSGNFLIEAIQERIAGLVLAHPPLVLSILGDDAVLYGALSLAQMHGLD